MSKVKRSFLSDILGRSTYEEFRGCAPIIIAIGTCVLSILFVLSFFLHWKWISNLLNMVTGTSILFALYAAAFVVALDIGIDVEKPEDNYLSDDTNPKNTTKPAGYGLTTIWTVTLIALGIAAIHFSGKYSKHYAFECTTFLVDREERIYHIRNNGCEVAKETFGLEEMKGYQIEQDSYTLCQWCEEWAEDAEEEYRSDKFLRR